MNTFSQRRGLLCGLAGERVLASQHEHQRTHRGCLDRLTDQAGALADLERLRERNLRACEITIVALRYREAEQRIEGDLRPANLLGELAGTTKQLRRVLPVAVAPPQQSPQRVGQSTACR